MGDRRINPLAEKYEDRLKAIAGLLRKLTYKEMNALSELLQKYENVSDDDGYPQALLAISDDILGADDSNDGVFG